MEIAGKNMGYYWDIIKLPLLIFAITLPISFLLELPSITGPLLLILAIILPLYVGWITVKKQGKTINATISGALFGMGVSVILAVVALVCIIAIFTRIEPTADMPADIATRFIMHRVEMCIIPAIIIPAIYIPIALIASTITGFIAKKTMKKPSQ